MQRKRFWSETYREFLQFRMTTSAIKKVNRMAGGIDEYLMKTPAETLLYPKAIAIQEHLNQLHERRKQTEAEGQAGVPLDYIAPVPPMCGGVTGPRSNSARR